MFMSFDHSELETMLSPIAIGYIRCKCEVCEPGH